VFVLNFFTLKPVSIHGVQKLLTGSVEAFRDYIVASITDQEMTASLIWKRKFPGQVRNFFNTVSHPDLVLKSRLNQIWYVLYRETSEISFSLIE